MDLLGSWGSLAYPSSFGSLGPEFKSQRPHHSLILFYNFQFYINLILDKYFTETFKYKTLEKKIN